MFLKMTRTISLRLWILVEIRVDSEVLEKPVLLLERETLNLTCIRLLRAKRLDFLKRRAWERLTWISYLTGISLETKVDLIKFVIIFIRINNVSILYSCYKQFNNYRYNFSYSYTFCFDSSDNLLIQ